MFVMSVNHLQDSTNRGSEYKYGVHKDSCIGLYKKRNAKDQRITNSLLGLCHQLRPGRARNIGSDYHVTVLKRKKPIVTQVCYDLW